MRTITYKKGYVPETMQIIEIYQSSGIKRPIDDIGRIEKMYANSNIIITAWENKKLVGVARALTDFSYCCYLSDLAVRQEYQSEGIGKQLIEEIKKAIGTTEEISLLLLSAPNAMEYYPKVGFEAIENGFIIKRKK
ncbi:GNAT family N-acetyltransferase [Capnocytophaga stomatis]|uniref:GNAT family N-acetyltransferase n=1 Tax=Capnocytophaga stomatis TaxID=1848904 RepID=UPI001ACADCEA|nr:GNAT family N-acetyltransferase [Capnocytophaga stomatis]GIM50880.1 N-acetyltransferase [Capnocytophaga stomatis]